MEANRNLLQERLAKPEWKLVLRIIDDESAIANELSLDSFLYGFGLAWKLTNELNYLKCERSDLTEAVERSAHFVCEGGDAT